MFQEFPESVAPNCFRRRSPPLLLMAACFRCAPYTPKAGSSPCPARNLATHVLPDRRPRPQLSSERPRLACCSHRIDLRCAPSQPASVGGRPCLGRSPTWRRVRKAVPSGNETCMHGLDLPSIFSATDCGHACSLLDC
ncbi:hypothetical protein PAHAL_5G219700 [Panicum hallii]|uniref:Uncharacterized protein n=1 Tax=Panicum hallii TaxID=206008 RepID=A0A2T8IKU1_9POAL|nr:hypothetical protein PAHAL_5G219700 [Panicum hallii]